MNSSETTKDAKFEFWAVILTFVPKIDKTLF